MKNRLGNLNDHLFEQLERLNDEDLTAEEIAREVQRAGAIVNVADQIVRNADLQLKVVHLIATHGERVRPMLPALEGPRE